MQYAEVIEQSSADTYRYLNFNQIDSYQAKAEQVA
jgi:aconitate hydratase 2/2-methylisocitrate dehydratase